MPHRQRNGLGWAYMGGSFELKPQWERQPQLDNITQVCRRALDLSTEDRCLVTFHGDGAFNKDYLGEGPRGKFLLRVLLSVDPKHKTRAEVTTLGWIRRMTHVPVPKVIAFDDSQDNEIGYEWILMELMPGVLASKRWYEMPMDQKKWVVEQVAEFQSQLFRHSLEDAKFQSIGTLSPKHFDYDMPRGPFRTSHDWLSASLGIIFQEEEDEEDQEDQEDENDEKDKEDGNLEDTKYRLQVANKLTKLLPKIFPLFQNPAEPTVLWHDHLSLSNILVDDDGKIMALIGWECVSCKPLWVATGMPEFLVLGRAREKEPNKDYPGGDDAKRTRLYWIRLFEFQQTQLRKVYAGKMKQLWPQWETEVASAALKLDFLGALGCCLRGWSLDKIEQWIDAVEGGAFPRLMDFLEGNVEG
ncbi:phosphotransferase enzyme family-domain-containing protein [Chaetomium tenue]|uniref:Phosphotransferase enzyme family-domain-containing protein n=1 Tax=Chaetomium tenue TaxID=1854479 RepID=A0ACB7P395_9PEZI|nr:phosphotransferase enzyme family-domain-containing protein [Chaetomium globosum]